LKKIQHVPRFSSPSRKEKLQRKIRGLTNSAFRRLQHQNSRGFWAKGLQKLTP